MERGESEPGVMAAKGSTGDPPVPSGNLPDGLLRAQQTFDRVARGNLRGASGKSPDDLFEISTDFSASCRKAQASRLCYPPLVLRALSFSLLLILAQTSRLIG